MIDLAEFLWSRYNSGQQAPIGTFVNFRTLEYYQQASDGALPQDGTFCLISSNATLTAAQIATTINSGLGTAYTSASFHAHGGGDAAGNPGQASDDA
jgi:hypothetical protein